MTNTVVANPPTAIHHRVITVLIGPEFICFVIHGFMRLSDWFLQTLLSVGFSYNRYGRSKPRQ